MIPKYKTITLTLERTIPASPAEVYEAWIDPATPGTPWHDKECETVLLDPKVDGLYHFKRVSGDGVDFPHYGRFVSLEPAKHIAYTWMSPFTRGLESVVTVDLSSRGADTVLVLRHANLPDDELGRLHEGGWAERIGATADGLAARRRK